MIRPVMLATALLCAVATPSHARPKHHLPDIRKMVGCTDPVMRPCVTSHHVAPARTLMGRRYTTLKSHTGYGPRPRAWCGWWLGRHLGMPSRALWRALAWRHVGRAAHGPAIGVVVIWSRGKGRGHVGIITGKTARGWVVKSGNDGNAVRERVRSVSTAIAFRWP